MPLLCCIFKTNTEWEHLPTQKGSIPQVPFVLTCWITLCRLWNCCHNSAVLSLQPSNIWTYNPNRDCISAPSPLSLHVRAPYLLCPDYCPAGNADNFPNLLSVLAIYSPHGGSDTMPVGNFPELWAAVGGKVRGTLIRSQTPCWKCQSRTLLFFL